jgi:hypothetical protein
MPIRFSSGGGSGMPYIRFSPAVNAWSNSLGEEIDIKDGLLAIDIENMQMGWLFIAEGQRDWQAWPSVSAPTPQPGEDYKQGFRVLLHGPKLLGDEVHEWTSNQVGCTRFIESLYNSTEQAGAFGTGNVPLVKITGSTVLKIGKGSTREITYEVVKYVPRPAAMAAVEATPAPAPRPAAAPKATPPATGSTKAAPPKAAPAPVVTHEEELEY